MYDYKTPIRKKTYLLGLTLPQLGLLAGMGIVMLVILVLGLKLVVFAPPAQIVPTVTPIVLPTQPSVPQSEAAQAPTPLPDLSTGLLALEDLPAGFVPAADENKIYDFNKSYPKVDFQPANQFAFTDAEGGQYVIGWVFMFTTAAEQEKFNTFIARPNELFSSADFAEDKDGKVTVEVTKLENPIPIGELSTGWSLKLTSDKTKHADIVLFSHKNLGGIVKFLNKSGQPSAIGAWEAAQMLDNRLMKELDTGPIPTPVVIAVGDLAGASLMLENLPTDFQPVPESDLHFDETARAELTAIGVQTVREFGFQITKPGYEEFILGYTYLFSSTMVEASMNTLLSNDAMWKTIYSLEGKDIRWEQWKPLNINKDFGDWDYAAFLTGMSDKGGIRLDLLNFRRGRVGVMLLHGYHSGMWKITIEKLGQIMEQKIETLTGSR